MSMAWEVTQYDIAQVFERRGISKTEEEIERIYQAFDSEARVEEAVLACTDFYDQIEAALQEIEDILIGEGYLSRRKEGA